MLADDSVVIVTGGASGLGEAVVRMATQAGGLAGILDLPNSRGASLSTELGDGAHFSPVDVTQPNQVAAAVDDVAAVFGRVDVLVSCAGVSPGHRTIDRDGNMFPLDIFAGAVAVNLIGLFDVVRHAARHMSRNAPGADGERGLIVNVASIAAFEGQAGQTAYAASKAGVAALTLPLARDLARFGIRVMSIAPGIMDTPMLAGLDERRRAALLDINLFPKRLGTPGDFASLVRCVMENPLLNGEVVRLDAGTRLG